jgi:hypothetical protein
MYTVVPVAANGCAGSSFYVVVSVNPEPVVNNQTATVCSDVPTALNLGLDLSGPNVDTYHITSIASNGLNFSAGAPAIGSGLGVTNISNDAWTNLSSAPVNVVYTVIPKTEIGGIYQNSGLCSGNPFTVTITVNPEPVGIAGSANSCSDVAFTVVLDNSDVSNPMTGINYSYSWAANGNNDVTGEGSGTGNIVQTINNETTSNQTVTYVITPTGSNTCVGNTFNYVATIKPEPVVSNQTAATCSDVALNLSLDALVTGTGDIFE